LTGSHRCAPPSPSNMKSLPVVILAVAAAAMCLSGAQAEKGFGDTGGQEYGYVDVREGAHMFYWLHYVKGGDNPAGQPLVIWLQGGPGASSTSFGNFEEIGPLDTHLKRRNSTWVNHVNLMFVDNPVGTGFSYVDRTTQLATTNKQIALDLVELVRGFLNKHPQFKDIPLYIFSESYGGKMAAEAGLYLFKEKESGKLDVNIKGVALGDSWISPIDSVLTWAPYLLQTGMVDTNGFKEIQAAALATKKAVDENRWADATSAWGRAETVVMQVAAQVDFYNILTPVKADRALRQERINPSSKEFMFHALAQREADIDMDTIMNEQVKPALGVPSKVRHQDSSSSVFNALYQDFMRPVTDVVERLLNETSLTVAVFTGQLDLIVDTPGTLAWAERLQFKGADYWVNKAPREPLTANGIIEGFRKTSGKFEFYWINRAGHMVPSDNPAGAIEMLKQVTGFE